MIPLITGYRQTNGWARTRTVYFAMLFQNHLKAMATKDSDKVYTGVSGASSMRENNFPEMAGRADESLF